jgi:endonuclease-8
MPEGDTIHRACARLTPHLAGKRVRRLELPRRAQVVERVNGSRVSRIEARGKNLLIHFEGDSGDAVVLHTHLKMNGVWRVYAPGGPRPHRSGSVVVWLEVDDGSLAVCTGAPVVRLLRLRDLDRDPRLAALGPDPIDGGTGFDRGEALRRLRDRADVPLGEALLDQGAIAGIGNVWKSELCFQHGLDPFSPVRAFCDEELDALLASAERGMRRSALGRPRPHRVYGRAGEPCLRCGERIVMRRQGAMGRSTYACTSCQPARS